jgi:four helix bundle protein
MKVEELDVYKLSHELILEIYRVTKNFPDSERFGLTSQMRRSSASICMNLMEGAHRLGRNEYRHFVSISRGSCGELKYQLILSRDLGFIDSNTYNELGDAAERVSMMLTKLHTSLK